MYTQWASFSELHLNSIDPLPSFQLLREGAKTSAEWLLESMRMMNQGPRGWAKPSSKEQAGSKPEMRLSWKQTQQEGSPVRHKGSL